jgi:hypothetical protein
MEDREACWEDERPGEEEDEREEVEELWEVEGGDVVLFVAEDDAVVPEDEEGEGDEER